MKRIIFGAAAVFAAGTMQTSAQELLDNYATALEIFGYTNNRKAVVPPKRGDTSYDLDLFDKRCGDFSVTYRPGANQKGSTIGIKVGAAIQDTNNAVADDGLIACQTNGLYVAAVTNGGFHWHAYLLERIYFLHSSSWTNASGRMGIDAENAVLEMLWDWASTNISGTPPECSHTVSISNEQIFFAIETE